MSRIDMVIPFLPFTLEESQVAAGVMFYEFRRSLGRRVKNVLTFELDQEMAVIAVIASKYRMATGFRGLRESLTRHIGVPVSKRYHSVQAAPPKTFEEKRLGLSEEEPERVQVRAIGPQWASTCIQTSGTPTEKAALCVLYLVLVSRLPPPLFPSSAFNPRAGSLDLLVCAG